jgi:adenosylcobinamide-phosphate synthase
VVLIGAMIAWLDRSWNQEKYADALRRVLGVIAILSLLLLAWGSGWLLHAALSTLPHGMVIEALIVAVFLAQNSLYRHVAAVERGFVGARLAPAQAAVGLIVGRDPTSLDQAGTCRAAIESLAENFSDGIVAPAFWYLVLGLPGLIAYKALNTADSMIGHRTDRHLRFGWATARLDDLTNFIPARLTALILAAAACLSAEFRPKAALVSAFRDARRHRSVNAGWPEAAMAGALGARLAGPRTYNGIVVEDAWMGNGDVRAIPEDIRRALWLYVRACGVMTVLVGLVAFPEI